MGDEHSLARIVSVVERHAFIESAGPVTCQKDCSRSRKISISLNVIKYFSTFSTSSDCSFERPTKYASNIRSTSIRETSDCIRCILDDDARASYVGTSRASSSRFS